MCFVARVRWPALAMLFVFLVSGCGLVLPTPSHRETVEIDPALTNPELTDNLLAMFAEQGISQCRGIPGRDESLPDCSIPWWQGNLSRVDRDAAIIEIGDFPAYATNSVGHSARFSCISGDTLEITVRGVFFYLGPIPNDDVARDLVMIIRDNL